MLSFTPVSGKEEGKRRKEREGEEGVGCDALHPVASVSSCLTQPGITREVLKLQVAKAEAPHLHETSQTPPQLRRGQEGRWTGKAASKDLGSLGWS